MRIIPIAAVCLLVITGATASVAGPAHHGHHDGNLANKLVATDRTTAWQQLDRIPLDFETYHPQGMALVGDRIFLSSVEVLKDPKPYPHPVNGYDRSPGKGIGHLFVLNRDGELLDDIRLGSGHSYHPGGIDFDGKNLWVPVAEYRPDSAATVYRVDPDSLDVEKAFDVDDHIGGVVRDQVTGQVHGLSWGSRRLYTWTPHGHELARRANRDHLIDYQDCAYVQSRKQLCTGVTSLPTADGGQYELGGLALLNLGDDSIVHEFPFPYFSSAGHVLTRNPIAIEPAADGLRLFAAPDDGEEKGGTELYVYEAAVS